MTNSKSPNDADPDNTLLHQNERFRKRLVEYGRGVIERAEACSDDLFPLLDMADFELNNIVQDCLELSEEEEFVLDAYMQTIIDEISSRKGRPENATRNLFSGLAGLDSITGGFEKGDLVVLVGRRGVGKTSLLLSMLDHMTTVDKKPVGLFCPGTDPGLICQRLLAVHTKIGLQNIQCGELSPDQRLTLEDAAKKFRQSQVFLNCSYPGAHVMFRAWVTHAKVNQNVACLVVDGYTDLVDGFTASGAMASVTNAWRRLREIAYTFCVPVILSICVPERSEGEVQIADLRQYMPQASLADKILLLNCDQQEHMLTVEKNSSGRTGVTSLAFDQDCLRFESACGGA